MRKGGNIVCGFRVARLLVGFRRFDGCNQLTGSNACSLVHQQSFYVAGNLRVDRRFVVTVDFTRKQKFPVLRNPDELAYQNRLTAARLMRQLAALTADSLAPYYHYAKRGDQ